MAPDSLLTLVGFPILEADVAVSIPPREMLFDGRQEATGQHHAPQHPLQRQKGAGEKPLDMPNLPQEPLGIFGSPRLSLIRPDRHPVVVKLLQEAQAEAKQVTASHPVLPKKR
jgi:hypothetical protein